MDVWWRYALGLGTLLALGACGETPASSDAEFACNGHLALCDRPYNEVVFPGTHNSFSARSYGFFMVSANHDTGLTEQLEAGVRVFLLDVTYNEGTTALCHGPCLFGALPHADGLREIVDFLDTHPREVLTIIYQDDAGAADIVRDLETSGLADMVYAHTPGQRWPTLGEMIDANTRLVVTAESQGPPPEWFHHVWELTWDTPFTWMSIDAMNCDLNRGQLGNDLFLVNHWVNDAANLPDASQAAEVNALDVLLARVEQCQSEHGRLPNFLAIDWWEQGDLFEAVDRLNGL
ncbi:MAG: hypothetical protein AAFN74_13340 [Myxococcota bacterium]